MSAINRRAFVQQMSAAISAAALEEQPVPGDQAPSSPDDLGAVQDRIAALPPLVMGKDLADRIGASVGSVVLVTSLISINSGDSKRQFFKELLDFLLSRRSVFAWRANRRASGNAIHIPEARYLLLTTGLRRNTALSFPVIEALAPANCLVVYTGGKPETLPENEQERPPGVHDDLLD